MRKASFILLILIFSFLLTEKAGSVDVGYPCAIDTTCNSGAGSCGSDKCVCQDMKVYYPGSNDFRCALKEGRKNLGEACAENYECKQFYCYPISEYKYGSCRGQVVHGVCESGHCALFPGNIEYYNFKGIIDCTSEQECFEETGKDAICRTGDRCTGVSCGLHSACIKGVCNCTDGYIDQIVGGINHLEGGSSQLTEDLDMQGCCKTGVCKSGQTRCVENKVQYCLSPYDAISFPRYACFKWSESGTHCANDQTCFIDKCLSACVENAAITKTNECVCGDVNKTTGFCCSGNIFADSSDKCPLGCIPNWVAGEWSACNLATNKQTKNYTDSKDCGITQGKPTDETRDCSSSCQGVVCGSNSNSTCVDGVCKCNSGFFDSGCIIAGDMIDEEIVGCVQPDKCRIINSCSENKPIEGECKCGDNVKTSGFCCSGNTWSEFKKNCPCPENKTITSASECRCEGLNRTSGFCCLGDKWKSSKEQCSPDPCKEMNCGSHSNCSVGINKLICKCDLGFFDSTCTEAGVTTDDDKTGCVKPDKCLGIDPCKNIICGLNSNSTCKNGKCECNSGYFDSSCADPEDKTDEDKKGCSKPDPCLEETDPCEDIICGENSKCNEGNCKCNSGFFDSDCTQKNDKVDKSKKGCLKPDPCADSTEEAKLCDDIVCADSERKCPDSSIKTCENICSPLTGQCSHCDPESCPAQTGLTREDALSAISEAQTKIINAALSRLNTTDAETKLEEANAALETEEYQNAVDFANEVEGILANAKPLEMKKNDYEIIILAGLAALVFIVLFLLFSSKKKKEVAIEEYVPAPPKKENIPLPQKKEEVPLPPKKKAVPSQPPKK